MTFQPEHTVTLRHVRINECSNSCWLFTKLAWRELYTPAKIIRSLRSSKFILTVFLQNCKVNSNKSFSVLSQATTDFVGLKIHKKNCYITKHQKSFIVDFVNFSKAILSFDNYYQSNGKTSIKCSFLLCPPPQGILQN